MNLAFITFTKINLGISKNDIMSLQNLDSDSELCWYFIFLAQHIRPHKGTFLPPPPRKWVLDLEGKFLRRDRLHFLVS